MARTNGPLFSESASKKLGKTMIFKTRDGRTHITKYNKPGYKNPFNPSDDQIEQRDFYGVLSFIWKNMSDADKANWNEQAGALAPHMSGWNYFIKRANANPADFANYAFYGQCFYGFIGYGKE